MSAAQCKRDFYLSKVDQYYADKHLAEQLQKETPEPCYLQKQKVNPEQDPGRYISEGKVNPEQEDTSQSPYNQVMQQYLRTRPLAEKTGENKQLLSKDVWLLSHIFYWLLVYVSDVSLYL
ncbi:hypothetical protein POM88_021603 [Heracleum sosnowskyi]|uniref:Uncharacterized protein n=1 Tax=Heracleum sosnowskyi TaxID=360622 RepID=A0AAD8MTZ0_9APIA|nr:hypothetical protein POM88_021603 [Heracleum sosnowskyi]